MNFGLENFFFIWRGIDWALIFLGKMVSLWWWLLPPILLYSPVKKSILWWQREKWEARQKYVMLEIVPPKESLKPLLAMEQVFSSIWSIYSSIEGLKNFRKKWMEGRRLSHLCIEIASIGPHPRFFIRLNKKQADAVRVAFYAQYPDVEFHDVPEGDYTQAMAWTAPDRQWNFYGFDIAPAKSDVYPIKTYSHFFEPRPESTKEEKRIDPLNNLLEGLNELKPDEQIWLQFRLTPVSDKDSDFRRRGRALLAKLVHRKEKVKSGDGFVPPEMKMTPHEKDVVKEIEDKLSKYVFQTNIRCLYIARREIFDGARRALAEQYFSAFSSPDLNILRRWSKTKTKIRYFFIKRREYLRRRNMLRRYLLRETPLYPKHEGTFILGTEEVATLIHMPIELTKSGSSLPRVETKKSEAPIDLPI
ncbi:MAG: hypothetical protein AAB455_03730 [Patescibacteria group bacterium]